MSGVHLDARRRSATGYGSPLLWRASHCVHTLRFGGTTSGARVGALGELPALICYVCLLPREDVPVTDNPAGRQIAAHLSLRWRGIPLFRLAQGVLRVPPDFSTYLQGHARQAVRTNIHRAQARGVRCQYTTRPAWSREWWDRTVILKQAAPVEHWWATNRAGLIVGEAWLTVDEQCALLHNLIAREQDVRWLLHSAMVCRLSFSPCRLLITYSLGAPAMTAGQQHFQHLLGYEIAHLRPLRISGRYSAVHGPRSAWRLRPAGFRPRPVSGGIESPGQERS
jgi:hypothetical protein